MLEHLSASACTIRQAPLPGTRLAVICARLEYMVAIPINVSLFVNSF